MLKLTSLCSLITEYIPIELLRRELDSIIVKVNVNEPYDERRLEHLLACLEINPQYKEEKELERKAWKERIAPFCTECLSLQRDFTPPHVFSASFYSLCDEGLSVALAKRLMAKPCLWLTRMKPADISKLHEVELTNRYGYEGLGLDLVELSAVYACLPHDSGFKNDPSGRKSAYLSRLEDSLKAALTAQDSGKLPQAKQRAPCYVGAEPRYKHRRSLIERFLAGSSEALDNLRKSLARMSSGPANNTNNSVDVDGRESLGLYAVKARALKQGDVEMQPPPPRLSSLGRDDRLSAQRSFLGTIDEIPNPMLMRSANPSDTHASTGVTEAVALSTSEGVKERRHSIKSVLEGVFAKRL